MSSSGRRGVLTRLLGINPQPRVEQPLTVRPEVNPYAGMSGPEAAPQMPEIRVSPEASLPPIETPPRNIVDQLMGHQADRRTFMEYLRAGALAARTLPRVLTQAPAPAPAPAPREVFNVSDYLSDYAPISRDLPFVTNPENAIRESFGGRSNYYALQNFLRDFSSEGGETLDDRIREGVGLARANLRGRIDRHNNEWVPTNRARNEERGVPTTDLDREINADEVLERFNRLTIENPEFMAFRRALVEEPELGDFVGIAVNPSHRYNTSDHGEDYFVNRNLDRIAARFNLGSRRDLTETHVERYYNEMLTRLSERSGIPVERIEEGLRNRNDGSMLRYMYGDPEEGISGFGENPLHTFLARRYLGREDSESFDQMFREHGLEPRTLYEAPSPDYEPNDYSQSGRYTPYRRPPGGEFDGPED